MSNTESARVPNTSTMDKNTRLGWQIRDTPGEFAMINKNDIMIDESYQRTAKHMKIRDIASSWSWVACGSISVAIRDRKYYAIDGQHRVLAARNRSDIQMLPCLVFHVKTLENEAIGFLQTNCNRKPLTILDRYNAMLVSNDSTAQSLQRLFDKYGLKPTSTVSSTKSIKCISSCLDMIVRDKESFDAALELCAALEASAGISDRILRCLFLINRHGKGVTLQTKWLRKRILALGADGMTAGIQRAVNFLQSGGEKTWLAGVVEVINKGSQQKLVIK